MMISFAVVVSLSHFVTVACGEAWLHSLFYIPQPLRVSSLILREHCIAFFYAYCSFDAFALKRECVLLGGKPHSFGELKLISSKFSYTQHSANKFASVFVCTNFPVVAKLVPMSVTQIYLQVTKRVQPSFANAVHCYGFALPPPL